VFLVAPPRDAESDAFVLAYAIGFGIYSTFGLLIAWFAAQYLSTRDKGE
jgi:hypothetical protein